LNDVYKKSVVLITNFRSWYNDVDDRIKSRLLPEMVDFKKYTRDELSGILKQRIDYAFVPGVWESSAVEVIADTTAQVSDVRVGLRLLREAGLIAEAASSRKITEEHARKACEKSSQFIVHEDELDDESHFILDIIRNNSGAKVGDIFKLYQEKDGKSAYKTFHRKIEQLERNMLVSLEKVIGGKEGSTTLIKFGHEKKLSEF
jgi:archaeal cell division control protein 6